MKHIEQYMEFLDKLYQEREHVLPPCYMKCYKHSISGYVAGIFRDGIDTPHCIVSAETVSAALAALDLRAHSLYDLLRPF